MDKKHGILVKEHMEFAVQGPVTATGALSGGLQIPLLRSVSGNCACSMRYNEIVGGEMRCV